jgi:hypothetical protein
VNFGWFRFAVPTDFPAGCLGGIDGSILYEKARHQYKAGIVGKTDGKIEDTIHA